MTRTVERAAMAALVVLALSSGACAGDADSVDFGDHSRFDVRVLTGEIFSQAPALGRPWQAEATESILWVVDGAGDPGLHLFNRQTGELIRSVGRKGEGPGEFSSAPWNLDPVEAVSDAVWVFDSGAQRMMLFDRMPPVDDDGSWTIVNLEGPPFISNAAWLGPDLIAGVTATEDERIVFLDDKGRTLRSARAPFLGSSELPLQERMQASVAGFRLCAEPERGALVFTYFGASLLEQYDTLGNRVLEFDVPFPVDALFERSESGNIVFRMPFAYYIDCDTTGSRLYALFSGRRGPEQMAARFVHVFDWNGALQEVLQLEPPVRGIAVDAAGETLYGVSRADATIYRFLLR